MPARLKNQKGLKILHGVTLEQWFSNVSFELTFEIRITGRACGNTFLDLTARASHSAGLGRGLRTCIFNKFSEDGDANPIENHYFRMFKNGTKCYLSSPLPGRLCTLRKEEHTQLKGKKALVLELHIMIEHGKQRLKHEEAELLGI